MDKGLLKKHLGLIILTGVLVILCIAIFRQANEDSIDLFPSSNSKLSCNVGTLTISGYLDTKSEENKTSSLDIAQAIRKLGLNKQNEAVVLLIDTTGGTAPAAEEISGAIKEMDIPIIAFVRGAALSGGYWIAASTDHIVSLETSLIGNIGVTFSYLQETSYNQKEGYDFKEITSGEYKEVGNPNKTLSEENRKYLQNIALDLFEIFKTIVMQNRKLSEDEFTILADGKFYAASEAKNLNLIDEIGGIQEIKKYISNITGDPLEKILLCEPEQI